MKFSDILASIIHDMKNSLGMVINTVDELAAENPDQENGRISTLQHESKRLSNNLIALLSLYKLENDRLDLNIEEIDMADFLDEVVIDNATLARTRGIALDYACDEELTGYFDQWLIHGVINNVIGNALRYTASRILIHAESIDGQLVITIEDDGSGFPQGMIDAQAAFNRSGNMGEGQTQLGLYFAAMIARLHKNGEQTGHIELANQQRLAGGSFSIWLP